MNETTPPGPLAACGSDQVGQLPPRWYCVSAAGLATLCADREDAQATAQHCDRDWPNGAPHRAVCLGDVNAAREAYAHKAGEYARKWWRRHSATNKHMTTTREAHEDFCALQREILKT